MELIGRIQEHLSTLSMKDGDTDTAWFLREALRELKRHEGIHDSEAVDCEAAFGS